MVALSHVLTGSRARSTLGLLAILVLLGSCSRTPAPASGDGDLLEEGTVASFTLLNGTDGSILEGFDPLEDGATIDTLELGVPVLVLRANTEDDFDGSVAFSLDGEEVHVDPRPPYTMHLPASGAYSVSAVTRPGTGGPDAGDGRSVELTILDAVADSRVQRLALVDADADAHVEAHDPLQDGALLDYATLGTRNLSIEAFTQPSRVGSVLFELDGAVYSVENVPPYAMAGDGQGGKDYEPLAPPLSVGFHTLTVTPFSKAHAQGDAGTPLTIDFEVTDDASAPNEPAVAADDAYEVARGGTLDVDAPGLLANDDDPDGDALTAQLVTGPDHGTLTVGHDGSFSYLHDGGDTTSDAFTYTAHDGTETGNTATVKLTVTADSGPANEAPAAQDDGYAVTVGQSLAVSAPGVLANDDDPDGDPLTATLVDGPEHGALTLEADGSFTYQHDGTSSTSDAFTYRAYDGTATSETSTVTLTIDSMSVARLALIDADADASVGPFDPLRDGAVIDYAEIGTQNLSVQAFTSPDEVGSVLFELDGEAYRIENVAPYAMAGDGSDGTDFYAIDPPLEPGSHTLTVTPYSETGAQGSAGASLTVDFEIVAASGGPPVAADDAYEVGHGGDLDVDAPGVLANDDDPDGDTLTAALVDGPEHGTLALNDDGSFGYVHDGSDTTSDTFTYTAHDGTFVSEAATVSITVQAPGMSLDALTLIDADSDEPITAFDPLQDGSVVTYTEIGTRNVTVQAFTTPDEVGSVLFELDGEAYQIENVAPYAMAGDEDGPDFHAIDPPLEDGLHTLVVTPYAETAAQGEAGTSMTITFEIVDDDPNVDDPPFAEDEAYEAFNGTTRTVDPPGVLTNDFDPEGQPLTANLVDPPANGTVALASDGGFTYTHDGSDTTSDTFTYAANDGTHDSNVATVTMTIQDTTEVTHLTLLDADANTAASGFDPLTDGAIVHYAELGTQNLNVLAHTRPETVGSVLFTLNGQDVAIESEGPYALGGDDDGGDFFAIVPPLPTGTHILTATPYSEAMAQGAAGTPHSVEFEVRTFDEGGCTPNPSQFEGRQISSLECGQVKVAEPFELSWDGDEGGILDGDGTGHGFTMVMPPSNGAGHLPFLVDAGSGQLTVETTRGLAYTDSDSQDNALGVGLGLPDKPLRVATTLLDPPAGSGGYEQAGAWFGISEDDAIKLALVSKPDGPVVEALMEVDGEPAATEEIPIALPLNDLELSLVAEPDNGTVTARYAADGGAELTLFQFTGVPESWFSHDAAGIDFTVGTRSYGGVFASHRNGAVPLTYTFDDFTVHEDESTTSPPPPDEDTTVDFDPWRVDGVDFPTALTWAPDGRLYAANASGTIHALTIDVETQALVDVETIDVLGSRLALGLTLDPASTADDVILWAAHSDPSQNDGDANSGVISRLSGPGLSTREDVVTGLPRAIANHATNNIGFGADGRLYIAQGGNTGAGASNDGGSEFGPRPEQPLSAALLVADVQAAGFDGTCTSEDDPDGSQMDATGIAATDVPCDVEVYASGLRNAYDFTFHSNGHLYATDNGLGVEGTFPDLSPDDLGWSPADGCEGMIEGSSAIDEHNPGSRTDLLLDVTQGAYYGHPNPSRGECVFFGGNPTSGADYPVATSGSEPQAYMDSDKYDVGREPASTWEQPMFALGESKSANGIIEYASQAFCGELDGDLLLTYYSVGDQIRRVQISDDGTQVIGDGTLVRSTSGTGGLGLSNPLPIAQDPLGRVYVGEFGNGGKIAVFDPIGPSCWQEEGVTDAPEALLDAGGAALGSKLYLAGGKTSAGPQRSLYVYDAMTNGWSQGADLPADYAAVEDPAVVAHDGQLYAFGGSTEPFSGSVTDAARYDPATDAWTSLPDMPNARGGAAAAVIDDRVYVIGGRDGAGASMASMDVFDIASGTWSSSFPNMAVPRDNAGAAALDGKLYVFGGRTRETAFPDDPTLSSVERFDPTVGEWTAAAPMPTGRRAFTVTVVDGRAIAMGGEHTGDGGTFVANEAYDPVENAWAPLPEMPTGRHGAVAGRIGNGIYVTTGGPDAGSSFTADVDVFRHE